MLWNEVKVAVASGYIREEQSTSGEHVAPGSFADIRLITLPPFALGDRLALPNDRTAEGLLERYFESAGHTLVTPPGPAASTTGVIASTDEMHAALLDSDTTGLFRCLFWSVVIGEFRSPESVNPHYIDALFLNMAYFFTAFFQKHRRYHESPTTVLDLCSCLASAVHFALVLVFPRDKDELQAEGIAESIEQNVLRWTIGMDGVNYRSRREARLRKLTKPAHEKRPESPPSAKSPSPIPGTVHTREEKLHRYNELLRSLPTEVEVAVPEAIASIAHSLNARGDVGHGGERKPLVCRNTAQKSATAEPSGNQPGDSKSRATFQEIHTRCQLTREAVRQQKERENHAAMEAKRRLQMEQTAAEEKALKNMITCDEWMLPQRMSTRTFRLDAVSPLMKLFLVATAQKSLEALDDSNSNVSAFQRYQHVPAVHLIPRRSSPSPFQRPLCPRGHETTRVALQKTVKEIISAKHKVRAIEHVREAPPTCDACSATCCSVAPSSHGAPQQSYNYCPQCNTALCKNCCVSNASRPQSAASQRSASSASTAVCSDATSLRVETDPAKLFGQAAVSFVWHSNPLDGSASTFLSRPRATGIRSSTVNRWSLLIHELLTTEEEEGSDHQRFNFYLRMANRRLAEDQMKEIVEATNLAAEDMLCTECVKVGTEKAVTMRTEIHPSSLKKIDYSSQDKGVNGSRPPSAPLVRRGQTPDGTGTPTPDQNAKGSARVELGTFMTGVPVTFGPNEANSVTEVLKRPSSAQSRMPCPSRQERPWSASMFRESQRLRRPSSAMSHHSAISEVTAGTSYGRHGLSIGQRPPSPAIRWTVPHKNDDTALARFRSATKQLLRHSLEKVKEINANEKVREAARNDDENVYRANISRHAVEHLQEIRRETAAIERRARLTQQHAMKAVTEAIEAAVAKYHHPLKKIDALKEALHQIDSHFEDLPEAVREQTILFVAEKGPELASLIRAYKLTNRDKSQWPASLDDLRCSRQREIQKFGEGATYVSHSPTKGGSKNDTQFAHRDVGEDPFEEEEVEDTLVMSMDEVDNEASWAQFVCSGPPVQDVIEQSYATLLQRVSQIDAPSSPGAKVVLPCSSDCLTQQYPSMVPPSSVPSAPVSGSSDLILRGGVMMWKSDEAVVGKKAADVRNKYLSKQLGVVDPFRLRVPLV